MPADPRPDLVIVGDSHSAALFAAAKDRGLDARMLYLSGNIWHGGLMRWHGVRGLDVRSGPRLRSEVAGFAAEVGGCVFPADVPVLASFGYHLGRLAGLFGRGADEPPVVSAAFFDAWMEHHRRPLLRILRAAGARCDLTVVAPPQVMEGALPDRMAGWITAACDRIGLRVFDPRRAPGLCGPLADALRTPDRVHGNAAYGALVLDRVLAGPGLRAAG